jgi:multiple sugar transport system permease protein
VRFAERFAWRVLTTPMVAFLLLFLGFPTVVDLLYSVSSVSFATLNEPVLIGFANYAAVLGDPSFWRAGWFSLRFALLTAGLECVLGLALAVFLAPLLDRRNRLLALLLLPIMVAPALVGLMYRLVLHEFAGPIPHYLWRWFGSSPAFLSGDNAFWTLVVVETLQWTPFALLLFVVAYRGIPAEVREAAALDGAGAARLFWSVELPLMLPTLVIVLLIRFIDGLRVFDNVYTLTGSGPGGSTASLSIWIYETFFRRGAIGEAVAASVLLFIASFALLFWLNRAARRREAARR